MRTAIIGLPQVGKTSLFTILTGKARETRLGGGTAVQVGVAHVPDPRVDRLADVFQPHVVLLDLLMPGLNGVETLKRLKARQPSPRVIMLSAADDETVVKGALQLGAHFYVCKPIDLSKLEDLVKGFLLPT